MSVLVRIMMMWNLKKRRDPEIAKIFSQLLKKMPTIDQKSEILYALADFPEARYRNIALKIRHELAKLVRELPFRNLRNYIIYLGNSCIGCLRFFLTTFKSDIAIKLERLHFNDLVVFTLDLARTNEAAGVEFLRSMSEQFIRKAHSEGITHFGTVLWHMLMFDLYDLASTFIEVLAPVMKRKIRYLSDLANMFYLLARKDKKFAIKTLRMLSDRLQELIQNANDREIKVFIKIMDRVNVSPEELNFRDLIQNRASIGGVRIG